MTYDTVGVCAEVCRTIASGKIHGLAIFRDSEYIKPVFGEKDDCVKLKKAPLRSGDDPALEMVIWVVVRKIS